MARAARAAVLREYDAIEERSLATGYGAHGIMVGLGVCDVAGSAENLPKNRYNNILPLDANRVVLRDAPDYVNASHVSVPDGGGDYIIAQGPLHPDYYGVDTTGDFWRAVAEQAVGVVVMLARVDAGPQGAARYWPARVGAGAAETRGGLRLALRKETQPLPALTRRELELGPDGRTVVQLHYTGWRNYDVAAADELLEVVRAVEAEIEASAASGPPLVHCSGGIGRSGTFVSLLAARRIREAGGEPDLPDIVVALREARHPWMVEGCEQYGLLSEAYSRG